MPLGVPIMVPRGVRGLAAEAGVPGGIIVQNKLQNINPPSFTGSRVIRGNVPPSHPRILYSQKQSRPQYPLRTRIPPRSVRFYPSLRPTGKTLYPFPHQLVNHSLFPIHQGPSVKSRQFLPIIPTIWTGPRLPIHEHSFVSPLNNQREQYTEVPHSPIPKPFIPRDVRPPLHRGDWDSRYIIPPVPWMEVVLRLLQMCQGKGSPITP